MKKFVAILLAVMLAAFMMAGCAAPTQTPAATGSTAASASAPASAPAASASAASAPAANLSETGILNLDWFSAVGTDNVFECPWQDWQSMYEDMVFDTLVKLDTDGKTIVPSLAKSMEVSADGKTYTFTLVDNAKWHDGTPFTADDVLFSFNTNLAVPESMFKTYFSTIAGAQDVIDGKAKTISGLKADGNKVILTLSSPDNTLVKTIFAYLAILPSHLLKDIDPTLFTKNEAFWKKPVGTGAYKINEISFPNYFTVIRNEDYFGKKPNVKNVLFTSHVTGGVESVIADAIAGKLDFAQGNAVNDINNAKNIVAKNPDMKMAIVPASYQRQFWFNNVGSNDKKYNPDMQKVEVRQAINLLLDKEAIANFYKGQAVPLSTFVNPQLPAYNSDIPLFKRDAAKAKEMLTAAGFDFSRTIRILYYYDDQTTKDVMELIKQNFADAGVKAEPFLATGDLASVIYKVKNWDIMYAGQTNPDPIICYQLLVPDKGITDGLFGDMANRQSTFGALLNSYKAATDPAEMKKIGDQLQVEASKYSMVIPVYGLNKVVLYNAAKLKLDESIFNIDLIGIRDYKFDKWELLK